MITAVVCIDKNYGIGKDGNLLFNIKDDMKRFKDITTGGTIICGRKTYESFPKRPLKDRQNVVISTKAKKNPKIQEDKSILSSMEAIKVWLSKQDVIENNNGIHIVGGGQIYIQLLPFCERVYLTRVDKDTKADTFFPEIDKMNSAWELTSSERKETEDGTVYYFETWDRCDYKVVNVQKGLKQGDLIIVVETFNRTAVVLIENKGGDFSVSTDWEYLDNNDNFNRLLIKAEKFKEKNK